MNSENSKTTNPYGLLLNLSEKTNLKTRDKYVALSNLSIYNTWKNIKKLYKNNKLQISVPASNENLNYFTDQILYQKFKTILSISSKNMEKRLIIFQ